MLYNVDKCKVKHFYINDSVLPTCTVERDLRVLIQDNLMVFDQCLKAANTDNRILGMTDGSFSYNSSKPLINSL